MQPIAIVIDSTADLPPELSARYAILETIKAGLPYPPLVVNITPMIGVHIGPNGLGLAAGLRW